MIPSKVKRTVAGYLVRRVLPALGLALLVGKQVSPIAEAQAPAMGLRLEEPRIPPLVKSDWNEAQRTLLEPFEQSGRAWNVFTTMAQHPDLARDWLVFGGHILNRSTLPARDRELLILRAGVLCNAEYEWAQHTRIGKAAGISDAEILRIIEGPDAEGWSDLDAHLLRAADELNEDAFVSDATWKALAAHYSKEQMMDIVFTVGQYHLVSMALNSFGVQLDEGLVGFPK